MLFFRIGSVYKTTVENNAGKNIYAIGCSIIIISDFRAFTAISRSTLSIQLNTD